MKVLNSILLVLLGLAVGLPDAHAAKVMGVRSYRAPEYTRLIFDLDASLQYQIDSKSDARKVVIRLKNSSLAASLDKLNLGNTPITAIASSTTDHDTLVELSLRGKVEPRGFTLGKNEQYGDRLVVDLYDLVPKFEAMDDDKSDPIGAISASVSNSGKRDIVVAISAGHGGDDPGAIGVRKLQEKQLTLAISREVAAQLNKVRGYKAVLIRDDDYYVGLRQQINMAHDKHADLFIAIHADAADNKNARGATVYALSQRGATSEQARRLADKENSADLIGGVGSVNLGEKDAVLASVLLDLSMTASVASSLEIGHTLIKSIDKVTHLRRTNVEQAAFVVLKSADIPSLLVESGYITNAADAENLDSPQWRKQFAGAMVEGITRWFEERPPRGTLIAWEKDQGEEPKTVADTYTVKPGDSLSALAQRFHVSMDTMKTANNLRNNSVQLGQVLKIPGNTTTAAPAAPTAPAAPPLKKHRIAHGETLSQIANLYEVSLEAIRAINQLKSDNIRPGQILKIPAS